MNKEILEVVASVSMEKGVDKEIIFEALEEAIASASKKLLDDEALVNVVIDRKTGDYNTFRAWEIVDEVMNEVNEITEADVDKQEIVDGFAKVEIENIDFGRISAQAAKQVIIQKVREAERSKITAKYEGLVGQVISGQVKRINRDFLLLEIEEDLNAQIPRDQIIPGEIFKLNDRVRAVIKEIVSTPRGPQIILSRTDERLVVELFSQEVPEISEGTIEIKAISRDPGYRSKIAVKTYDGRIDPVGACVGMRGSRVQAVSSELGNERIDIIIYDDNPAQLVINALVPAKVESIVMDEDSRTMDIAVNQENLALAIGSRGQNIRLASKLVGWDLNIISSEEAEAKIKVDETEFLASIISSLEVSEEIAEKIVASGLGTFDDIAYADESIFKSFVDSDDEIARIKGSAEDAALLEAMGAITEEEDNVESFSDLNLNEEDIQKLSNKGIKNKDDLAELAVDELQEIIEISSDDASKMIMKAREDWFN